MVMRLLGFMLLLLFTNIIILLTLLLYYHNIYQSSITITCIQLYYLFILEHTVASYIQLSK